MQAIMPHAGSTPHPRNKVVRRVSTNDPSMRVGRPPCTPTYEHGGGGGAAAASSESASTRRHVSRSPCNVGGAYGRSSMGT